MNTVTLTYHFTGPGGIGYVQQGAPPPPTFGRGQIGGRGYAQPPAPPARGGRPRSTLRVVLQPGFAWNRESLGPLCEWREKKKKGLKEIARLGIFPGYTEAELFDVWKDNAQDAKRYNAEDQAQGY
jgi:hypothetical protein